MHRRKKGGRITWTRVSRYRRIKWNPMEESHSGESNAVYTGKSRKTKARTRYTQKAVQRTSTPLSGHIIYRPLFPSTHSLSSIVAIINILYPRSLPRTLEVNNRVAEHPHPHCRGPPRQWAPPENRRRGRLGRNRRGRSKTSGDRPRCASPNLLFIIRHIHVFRRGMRTPQSVKLGAREGARVEEWGGDRDHRVGTGRGRGRKRPLHPHGRGPNFAWWGHGGIA